MAQELGQPFDSIESAQEFMDLLQESIQEALRDVDELRKTAGQDSQPRRQEALQVVIHKLKQLSGHTHKNQRILNDLRSLRRLLFDERGEQRSESAIAAGSQRQ